MRTSVRALLWVVAAVILFQAVLAGVFLSVAPQARFVHSVVGSLLPWFAIVPGVLGGVMWKRREVSGPVGLAIVLLPVLLLVQEVLGHMPFPVTTAVHVPLGVCLLTYVVLLATAAGRRPAADHRVAQHVTH